MSLRSRGQENHANEDSLFKVGGVFLKHSFCALFSVIGVCRAVICCSICNVILLGWAMLRIQNVLLNPGLNCGFDHDFLPGGMTVVLGRNQAGKTNLCRLIAGLFTQADG